MGNGFNFIGIKKISVIATMLLLCSVILHTAKAEDTMHQKPTHNKSYVYDFLDIIPQQKLLKLNHSIYTFEKEASTKCYFFFLPDKPNYKQQRIVNSKLLAKPKNNKPYNTIVFSIYPDSPQIIILASPNLKLKLSKNHIAFIKLRVLMPIIKTSEPSTLIMAALASLRPLLVPRVIEQKGYVYSQRSNREIAFILISIILSCGYLLDRILEIAFGNLYSSLACGILASSIALSLLNWEWAIAAGLGSSLLAFLDVFGGHQPAEGSEHHDHTTPFNSGF